MEPTAEVITLADYETEITFPKGPVGILLEPVVRFGNRKVGARITGFSPSGDQDFFVKGRTSSPFPGSPSTPLGELAVEHLRCGNVLTLLDDICTKNMSFDRIMVRMRDDSDLLSGGGVRGALSVVLFSLLMKTEDFCFIIKRFLCESSNDSNLTWQGCM